MADSKPDSTLSLSDKNVKAPNVIERAKEEIEAVVNTHKHRKETHGKRIGIDEKTSVLDVKAPNVLERVKEEIEAIVQAVHQKKESQVDQQGRDKSVKVETKVEKPENGGKASKRIEGGKKEIEAIMPHEKSPRNWDRHGRINDIDENTRVDEIKGPSVFTRAKEEIEAIVDALHHKKESRNSVSSPKREIGFRSSIGKGLEKVCSPWGNKREQD